MKPVSDITACVVDHGLFLPLALKLGETYKRVLYHTPDWEQAFPTVDKCVIGDGFEQIERCDDIWKVKKEVDIWIFPDILHAGLQLELESQGCAVWGSRRGDTLEISREKFHRVLGETGLEVPTFQKVTGLTALREHLRDQEDKIIKISKYRGSHETCAWRNWKTDGGMLDLWAVRFGAVKELVQFLVFDKIETDIELGCDTFCIRGEWPNLMIQGYEAKDAGFLSAVRPRAKMPKQVQDVLEAFGPILGEYDYTNSFSMEIRVKDEHAYFIDPCCRWPMPPTSSKVELWGNLPEIILAGAHGELVEPTTTAKYAAECALTMKLEKDQWGMVKIPEELRQWCKFGNACQVDGVLSFPPLEFRESKVGWLVSTGDTLEDVIETMLERIALLPPGLDTDVMPLAHLLKEVREAEEQGIEFTDQKVPEPASVLEEA